MTDSQIESALDKASRTGRKITVHVLNLIIKAEERKLYAKRGFSTMKKWLVERFLYSDTAAYQRIQAARLLRAVPDVAEKIVSGQVNLSTLNTAEKIMREHEENTGEVLSVEAKAKVIATIENKSAWNAETALLKMFPDVKLEPKHETKKNIDDKYVRISADFLREIVDRLEEIRKDNGINGGFVETVTFLAKQAKPKRHKKTCEYQDPQTGRTCAADNYLEQDHILPVALGGTDEPHNKRWLCRTHNQLLAREKLGPLADYRGPSTRRLQLKAANIVAEFKRQALLEFYS